MHIYFMLLLLLTACQPNSKQDFHSEGTSLAKTLIFDLREIHSKEDFLEIAPRVKKKIQKLTDLMILSVHYQTKHPSEREEIIDRRYSDLLLEEFKRIYAMQGCREIMESLQRDSLHRLDAYLYASGKTPHL